MHKMKSRIKLVDCSNDEESEEEETSKNRGQPAMAHPISPIAMSREGTSRASESLRKGEEESDEFQTVFEEEEEWAWSPPKYGYQGSDSLGSNQDREKDKETPQ